MLITFLPFRPNNVTFVVSTHNNKTNVKLKKGDVVTFTYDDYSRRDTPFNARIYRVRDDLSWEEVVQRYLRDTPHAQALPLTGTLLLSLPPFYCLLIFFLGRSHAALDFKQQKHSYWTANHSKNARSFFENFARRRNMDPLIPENWYSVSWKTIQNIKVEILIYFRSDTSVYSLVYLLCYFLGCLIDPTSFRRYCSSIGQPVSQHRTGYHQIQKNSKYVSLSQFIYIILTTQFRVSVARSSQEEAIFCKNCQKERF